MKYDQKILIIRFSSIGDIVLATSPLKTIRTAYPEAQITFLTLDVFSSLLEFHPDIDALMTLSKKASLSELYSFRSYLKNKNYNLIFDLHSSLRSKILCLNTSAELFRVKKPRLSRFLLFRFHLDTFSKDFSTLKMYHESLTLIWNTHKQIPKTHLRLIENETNSMKVKLKDTGISNQFIVIIPGAAWKQKQWKLEKYIELIDKVKKDIILLGSNSDKICFDIKKRSKKVHNFAGKTTLREALCILSVADYVLGSDTGLTHAAESLGKPVTMILGPTSRQTGAGVNLGTSTVVDEDLWCRPCSQNGKAKCYRKNQICMDSISPDEVLRTITEA